MDWCAFWLAWISVVQIEVGFVLLGWWAYDYRQDILLSNPSTAYWLNWAVWLSWIFAGIYLLIILCNFKSLRIAIAVIETAADYFADTKRIILVPVLYFCIGVLIFIAWVYGMICVGSVGTITAESYTN